MDVSLRVVVVAVLRATAPRFPQKPQNAPGLGLGPDALAFVGYHHTQLVQSKYWRFDLGQARFESTFKFKDRT